MSSKIEEMAKEIAERHVASLPHDLTVHDVRHCCELIARAVLEEAGKLVFEVIGSNGLRRNEAVDMKDLRALFEPTKEVKD